LGITNQWRRNGAVGLRQRSLRGALTDRGGTLAYQAAKSKVVTEALGMNQAIKGGKRQ